MTTDLELYKIFVTVAQAGSFSAGAKELFLTQPAVSQAVQKLEQQLGARLFVRGRKGVTLTPVSYTHLDVYKRQRLPSVQSRAAH